MAQEINLVRIVIVQESILFTKVKVFQYSIITFAKNWQNLP